MKTVIVIVGPTASGKTAVAVELAKQINGEVISADSMQIYKYMDIGTAKPDALEMSGVTHHMIDEVLPDEEFSVAKFQQLALQYIEEIITSGNQPIIAGGTGLYINSLIYNISFSETISDWDLRESLKKEAEENGNKYLHEKLREIDPEAADRLHENDLKRIIRAIEVYTYTKKTMSYHQQVSRITPPPYRYVLFGLKMDRQKLYERINLRVDKMLGKGLVKEVEELVSMGYDKNAIAMQGLGYKEILASFKKDISYDEAVFNIKRDSRRYAKRQMTWFKRIEDLEWIDVGEGISASEIVRIIKYRIATFGIFL